MDEVRQILSRPELNLEHILEKYPSELSGGLMRLSSFLRAYIKKPEILILDEPFVGLDANLTDLLKALIIDLKENSKCCVIIISHQYSMMSDIGDRILYCDKQEKAVTEIAVHEIKEKLSSLKKTEFTDQIKKKKLSMGLLNYVGEIFSELGEFVLAMFFLPRSFCLGKIIKRFCSMFIDSFMLVGLGLFLIGFSIAFQSGLPLGMFNLIDKLPAIFGRSVFTEVGPLLLGLLLGSRLVAGLTSEIGSKKLNRTLDYLQVSGIDPIDFVFSPIYLATIPGAIVILIFSQLMALWGGAVAYSLVFNQSINAFLINSLNALSSFQWALVCLKVFLFLVVMYMESYRWGNKTRLGPEELGENVKNAIVHSAIGIIFVDIFFVGIIN